MPLAWLHTQHQGISSNTGVVDNDVHLSEVVDSTSEQAGDVIWIGDVALYGERITAQLFDVFDDLIGGVGV